jgi:hypothetical protein
MNVSQLRSTIVSLLETSPSLIGSYILPDGTNIPAVYVVGENSVPTEWKVEGLEVCIYEYPEELPTAGVGIVDMLKQWEVILMQYKPGSKELATAIDRMARRFPDAAFRRNRGNDVGYPRCRVVIPDREVRTVIR